MKFFDVIWAEWFVLPLLLALTGAIAVQLSTPDWFGAFVCFPIGFAIIAKGWRPIFDWFSDRRPRELARVARADEREQVITDLEGIVRATQDASTHWADRYASMLQCCDGLRAENQVLREEKNHHEAEAEILAVQRGRYKAEYLSTEAQRIALHEKWNEAEELIGHLSGEVEVAKVTIEDLGVEIEVARGEIDNWETRFRGVRDDLNTEHDALTTMRHERNDAREAATIARHQVAQALEDVRRAREDVVDLEATHKAETHRADCLAELLTVFGLAARRDSDPDAS